MTMTMTTMTMTMTMGMGRGRGRSRSRNLSGDGAGAGNFKNGRLRQPWILEQVGSGQTILKIRKNDGICTNNQISNNDRNPANYNWHTYWVEAEFQIRIQIQGSSGSGSVFGIRIQGLKKGSKMLNNHIITTYFYFPNILSFNQLLSMRKSYNYKVIWIFSDSVKKYR